MSQLLRHARLRYRLLLWVLIPPLGLLCLWLSLRYRDHLFLFQRLGYRLAKPAQRPIWLHTASVGEIHAALPLLDALLDAHPQQLFLVSTTTPTGGRILRSKLGPRLQWCYLPIDWPSAVRRFIQRLNPRCAIIVETELWPNLYQSLAQQATPILLVNGRLSQRSLDAPAWLLTLYRACLSQVTRLMARSQRDLERFRTLGAAPARSENLGNIKFHATPMDPAQLSVICQRPYILAASTHADEESRITRAWLATEPADNQLLVIAPRHPKRRNAILKDLQAFKLPVAMRSRNEAIQADTRIYLADTLGEMPSLISGAQFVIMGGSFVARGGHNILEPAALGKAIITGPFMDSFVEECQILKQANALIQCEEQTLSDNIRRLLNDPAQADAMGKCGQQVIQSQQQVLQHYLQRIEPYINNAKV